MTAHPGQPVGAGTSAAVVPSLAQLVEGQADRLGQRPFLALADTSLSFAELDELANRMAEVLASLGHGPGEIVMARCANSMAMVATWLGCAKLGSVYMPVNSLLTGEPLRAVMARSGARAVVCDAELWPGLAAVLPGLPPMDSVLVAGAAAAPAGARSLDTLLEAASGRRPAALAEDPGAPTKLMYTSGTTGTPKGVVWSRACEATWGHAYGDEMIPLGPGQMAYCCLPLFHITCQGTMLAALRHGGRMTIDRRFDPFGFWGRVRQTEAVVFSFVGTILSVLARQRRRPDDADNPVQRILGSAAPVELWREVEERFGLVIVETWGQTETASCWTRPESLPQRPGTVGRPSARFEARIAGPGGEDLGAGEVGEMWLRPRRPHVMFEGYLQEAGREEAARGGPLRVSRESWTEDGWYRTGDLMRRDEGGDFSFVGRLREAIRRRGEMIPAGEIERVALAYPGVLEAAAVGVPAGDGVEEEVKLCVVGRPEPALEPADLHGFLRDQLPKFMVPRYLDIRAELPKTPTTRVRKVALAAEGSAGAWDSRHPG